MAAAAMLRQQAGQIKLASSECPKRVESGHSTRMDKHQDHSKDHCDPARHGERERSEPCLLQPVQKASTPNGCTPVHELLGWVTIGQDWRGGSAFGLSRTLG